jgi:hypothetical protein
VFAASTTSVHEAHAKNATLGDRARRCSAS